MQPWQLLMLKVAAGAIDDASLNKDHLLQCGVFIGIELDLNTTNFHLRWSILNGAKEWNKRLGLNLTVKELDDWRRACATAWSPLTANRTMARSAASWRVESLGNSTLAVPVSRSQRGIVLVCRPSR